tara:strand:- start:704 stop:1288 length:585 start_codon:yes stop_codon:yes gene_type:complete
LKKNFQLKYVSEEVWMNTPEEIQQKKNKYSTLNGLINKRKGKLERLRREIKSTQQQLNENKKVRTILLDELQEFSENYIPSVSPYQSSSKSYQWSVNLKIGKLKKTLYLGSDKNVRKRMDEINGEEKYLPVFGRIDDLSEELTEEIRNTIQRNLTKELHKDFRGIQNRYEKKGLKMMDYLKLEVSPNYKNLTPI